MEDRNEYAYYQAIKEYENKNYEEALSQLDAIIEINNNNKLEYWAKYWRACTYYNLGLDKERKREPFAEVKHYFLIAKENFEEAKKISEKYPDNKEYNKQGLFIAFCKIGEAGSCYYLGKLTFEEKEIDSTEYFKDIKNYFNNVKSYFNTSVNLCKEVSESLKNNKINLDIKFKAFYTEASSYFQIGKIDLDEKQSELKKGLPNGKNYSKFMEAKSSFEKAIEINPDYEFAWIEKGNSSFELKEYREAIQNYNFAINLHYYHPSVWYFKGLALHNIARYEEAIDCYMHSITITKYLNLKTNENMNNKFSNNEGTFPDASGIYFNITLTESDILNEIGNAFYNLRLYSKALQKYDDSLTVWQSKYSSPKYKKYKYFLNKVWCLIASGRGKGALKDLEDDILNEYDDELHSFNIKGAANDLDKVPPEVKVYLVIALYLKGFILFKDKNNDSLEYVEKAIDINDKYRLNNPYPLYLKALIYNNDRKCKEALKYLNKSINLNDKFAEAYVAKAESLLLLDKKAEAAKELNKAIELAPNLGSAHALLSKTDSISTDGGPKFLQFWQATKKRTIIAILLVFGAIVLVAIPINALHGKMNEAVFGIVVVLVGLIAAIILLPDIGKVKVGNILEFDILQESQPGAKLKLDLEKPFIPLKS